MSGIRSKSQQIRVFILDHVSAHPKDIARVTANHFGISRQAVNRHVQQLVDEGTLTARGSRNLREYTLTKTPAQHFEYALAANLSEDVVWRETVAPLLQNMPDNVRKLWNYGFTEMVNNVIDHAQGTTLGIDFIQDSQVTLIAVRDNGVGIFRKIRQALNLPDERQAILDLTKGKLTTDPARHSGEGIFFTSKMCDTFMIESFDLVFLYKDTFQDDWLLKEESIPVQGTRVVMEIANDTTRTTSEIFQQYSDEDFGFTKTVVPVKLADYDEGLISRSQAKRLLSRFDRFKTVVLDFTGVDSIGQAFADEVFRVFPLHYPQIKLISINTHPEVDKMIRRAQNTHPDSPLSG